MNPRSFYGAYRQYVKHIRHERNRLCPKDEGKYSIIRKPGQKTPTRSIPDHIRKPCYYKTGIINSPIPVNIEIKNSNDIMRMRASCELASSILKSVEDKLEMGSTTDDIDAFIHEECIRNNAYPSTLYYKGFPKSCCTSVNNVVCHGIPDLRPLKSGDLVSVDITVFYQGYHGDCSKTFIVGGKSFELDSQAKNLLKTLEAAMENAINVCYPESELKNIGHSISRTAAQRQCRVIREVNGHGIGRYFHGPPDITHISNENPGKMKAGMTFTIEPALVLGDERIFLHDDGWTVFTLDGGRSVQMEHTVLITEHGCEVLTL